jgi:class 3 adenylate cyclase/tetratricopeptide (TPR) repeat protein
MDVGVWLRSLGLGQYEEKFRDNKIDADVLPHLTADDLTGLGVITIGDRRRLLAAIAALSGATPSADAPASVANSTSPKAPQTSAERRPITVMFCDLVGSTSLAAKLDPEDWRNLVNAYLDEASTAVTGLGGHVLKKLGDGLMALFGYPHSQENDAERAVRAALAIQRALAELNVKNAGKGAPELSARIGLESGLVVVDSTGEVFGDAPNVAARVQGAAEPGSVLITMNVQRQVAGLFVAEDKGAQELKGVAEPVSLFHIVRASGAGRRSGARALTPLVGRSEELDLLRRRWERARRGQGQLALIIGEPGIGKSRLVAEFRARLSETPHTFVEWSSSELLRNTPLNPVAEWGRQRFGADLPAEQRFADLENTLQLIGLDPADYAALLAPLVDIPLPSGRGVNFPPEELRRRQLAAMTAWVLAGARSQAVALAFEDLHWADPTSLDLMRSLAERGQQAPLFIIATTRPEFRPPWSLRSHHTAISLSPLDRAEVAQMVGEISSRHALSNEVIEGVNERTGGVPLFVEEVTRLLLERGAEGGAQAIPPTLQQSLAARLDRLGEAREIAQIGAVLGRDFSYLLLRAVAGVADPGLQNALDRLGVADLLFTEGTAPQATYRFKHALIQDAAYESLLKSRRQALHRRAAEILSGDPGRATAEPEAIAHHFTEAGLDDLAIEWWGKAGDQALRRSAFQEAIAHLGKAIAMADKAAEAQVEEVKANTAQRRRMTQFRVAFGNALIATRGYGAPETTEAFAAARESDYGENAEPERIAIYYGLWAGSYVRGDLPSMRTHAAAFLREVEARPESPEACVAHRIAGTTDWFAGEYVEARDHLERALALFQPGRDDDLAFRVGQDAGVSAMLYLAITLWPLGDFDRAISLIGRAHERIAGLAHIGTYAYGKMHAAEFELMRGNLSQTASNASELARLARDHDLNFWRPYAVFLESWVRSETGAPADGLEGMLRGLELFREQNNFAFLPLLKLALGRTEARSGDLGRAIATLDEALAMSERTGHRAFDAELNRARGELLLMRDSSNPAPAESALRTAVAIARQQGARSYDLLASLSLAKLWQSTGRPAEAYAVLAPALEGFPALSVDALTPGPSPKRASEDTRGASPECERRDAVYAEMPELRESEALLASLADSDEVKTAAARREGRLRLQVAYGKALMSVRGFGAPETRAAFARASEFAQGAGDASARFATLYGVWLGAICQEGFAPGREAAEEMLAESARTGDPAAAGVAHRAMGASLLYGGAFAEAIEHLDKAVAMLETADSPELALRFNASPLAAARILRALAAFVTLDPERAASEARRAVVAAERIGDAASQSYVYGWKAIFEAVRRNAAEASADAGRVLAITADKELRMWAPSATLVEEWAHSLPGEGEFSAARVRQVRPALMEVGLDLILGPVVAALAVEWEARTGREGEGLGLVEEILADASSNGIRWHDAELRRVRGEALAFSAEAEPARAEAEFNAAVAIAHEQGARAFALRAAASLAKLYQATNRPVDAHAVLAPALEGFSSTPEMPEIAEAQALLAALSETNEVKAAIAQRQQRLHLQTSYGQALMWGRGLGAEEASAAFARVTQFAGVTERYVARHAQCLRNIVRGEFFLARETAGALLQEAEADGRDAEASEARRMLGLVVMVQGDFTAAKPMLERALSDYNPERDAEARFRFGRDTRVSAAANLALAAWHMGEVERARQLIQQSVRLATELGHSPSVAHAQFFMAMLESRRDDASATRTVVDAVLARIEEHGIKTIVDMGQFYSIWARGRLLDPEVGANEVSETLKAYLAEGYRTWAPSFHGLLAEVEAQTGNSEGALASIDRGLAIAEETGERFTDPYLHRLRGEILLRRDPPNPEHAEEALQTAIAIAKEQRARSYILLASLWLAKLYQSTARFAEAHALLAPALEGFSSTPEMPEIAEAQALLAALDSDSVNVGGGLLAGS